MDRIEPCERSAGIAKRPRLVVAVLMVVAAALWSAGCEQALFPKDMARTPYDRYLKLRNQERAGYQENAYGGQTPALRDRLRPLGSP